MKGLRRPSRSSLALAFLAAACLAFSPTLRAEVCQPFISEDPTDPHCEGTCPPFTPDCSDEGGTECGCHGCDIEDEPAEPGGGPVYLELTLKNPFDPSLPLSVGPGGIVKVVQAVDAPFTIKHDAHWGGGSQTIVVPANTFSATIQFTTYTDGTHRVINFTFQGFQGTIPSFASVALGGGMTGDNVFSFQGGGGTLDLTSHELRSQLNVGFNNTLFCSAPAGVGITLNGNFDASTRVLHAYRNGANSTLVVAGAPNGTCGS